MKESHLLKQFQSQLNKLEVEVESIKSEISLKNKEMNLKQKSIQELREKIQTLGKKKTPIISEHALLRYLERVQGIDLTAITSEILTPSLLELIDRLGTSGQYPVKEKGFSVKLKNNVVVTII